MVKRDWKANKWELLKEILVSRDSYLHFLRYMNFDKWDFEMIASGKRPPTPEIIEKAKKYPRL